MTKAVYAVVIQQYQVCIPLTCSGHEGGFFLP